MKETDRPTDITRDIPPRFTQRATRPHISSPIRGIESTPSELRHRLIPRDRLLKIITTPFQAPVTIICAGAGYGKTSLALDWASQSTKHIAWLSLSAAEASIARFMLSLSTALLACSSSPADHPRPAAKASRSLDDTLGDIAALGYDSCLVIDNCHFLTNVQCLNLLEALIANQPSNLSLMLLTRQPLPLRLARLRSLDRIRELDQQDLRFTPEEMTDALQRDGELIAGLPPGEIERITRASHGWITGAHLALQSARREQIRTPLPMHPNVLDEYVQQEILTPLSATARHVALYTAGLPFISADLVRTIGLPGQENANIDDIWSQLAFVERDPADSDRYQLNPLFAESAYRIATRVLTDFDRETWRHTVVHWLTANGEPVHAAELANPSADIAWKTPVIVRLCRYLAIRSDLETLGFWLRQLPASTIEDDPDLSYWSVLWKAALGYTFGLDLPRLAARAAEPDADGLTKGRHAVCAGLLAYHEGKARDAARWLRSALDWLPPSADVERLHAGTYLGKCAFRRGEDVAATSSITEAAFHARALPIDEQWCWRIIAADRGNAYALRGDIPSAISKYRLMLAELPVQLATLEGFFHCRLVSLLIEQDDLAQARSTFEDAQRLPVTAYAEWRHDRLLAHLRLLLAEDKQDEAERLGSHYVKSLRRHPRKTQLVLLLAQIWLERDEWPMVESWLGDIESSDPPWVEVFGDINHRILALDLDLARENFAHAASSAEALTYTASATHRWSEFIALSMRWAVALHRLGDSARGDDVARPALTLAAKGGFVRALAIPGVDTTTMFPSVWNERQDTRRLKHALRNLTNAPPRPLAHTLTKRELEIVRLLALGRSNNQIAAETFISVNTVRNHLAKIFSKLEVISRSEAVARARQLDILD